MARDAEQAVVESVAGLQQGVFTLKRGKLRLGLGDADPGAIVFPGLGGVVVERTAQLPLVGLLAGEDSRVEQSLILAAKRLAGVGNAVKVGVGHARLFR